MPLTYVSLCDGIGAVHEAWAPLGWRCLWTSEIEPFPIAVVEHHWNLPNLGDMTKITEESVHGYGLVDLVAGGTPCQSFSVAGLRKGLADPRGNLALVFLGLMDLLRPRGVVWENVPGVLSSSGGRDFGAFLGALAELGYGFAWRVLDAQFLGVPQRRRRVFVVGYLGDWRPAVAVLLEPQGLRGDPAPRRKTRTPVARALTGSVGGCSAKEQQYTFVDGQGRPLNALCYGGGNTTGRIDVSTCLTRHPARQDFDTETFAVVGPLCSHSAEHGHAMTTQQAVEAGHIVTHALTARHDSSPDGTGRGVPLVPCVSSGRGWWEESQVGATVRAQDSVTKADTVVPVAFQPRVGRSGRGQPSHVVPALAGADAGATSDSRPCVATPMAVRRLTPRECERLQGFPDDYTLIQFRGKPAADGPRYRALGNSMAVPVMHWIGRRIKRMERLTQERTPVLAGTGVREEL